MARTKALANKVTIDMTKPIVKEFANEDDTLSKYLKMILPHIHNAKIRINKLYTSKDSKYSRYRINWYEEQSEGIMTKSKITASKYIQIETTKRGYKMTDLTI